MPKSIFDAVRDGNAADLREILAEEPEERNSMRIEISPLMLAVRENRIECAQILIEADADMELANRTYGWTPLHEAVKQANLEMIFLLLDYSARWTATDAQGNTIYHIAALHGQDPSVIGKLHAWTEQFTPDRYNKKGWTPLMVAASQQRLAQMDALVAIGADPLRLSGDGRKVGLADLVEGWKEGQAWLARQVPVAPKVEVAAPVEAVPAPEPVVAPASPAVAGLSSIQRRRPSR